MTTVALLPVLLLPVQLLSAPPCNVEPLTTPLPRHHLFAFAKPAGEPNNNISAWRSWDWAHITTIGLAEQPPPGFVCHAHAMGARVIQNAGVLSSPGRCVVGGWKPGGEFYPIEVGGCPAGKLIDRVVFASYGTPSGDCANGFFRDAGCDDPNSMALVERMCLGKSSCRLVYSKEWQGGGCAAAADRYLAVKVHCAGDPRSPPPPPGPVPPPASPPGPPLAAFATAQARAAWIAYQLANARHFGLDGLSIDIEVSSPDTRGALTSLVREAAVAFRSANSHALLAFSVTMYPNSDGRTDGLLGIDYAAISELVDVVFIMGYATAGVPPAAFGGGRVTAIGAGAAQYIKLGVAARKIVVGVLPGGVDFTCNVSSAPVPTSCTVSASGTSCAMVARSCVLPVDSSTGKRLAGAMVHRPYSFPTRDWPRPTVVDLLTRANISSRKLGWDNSTALPYLDYIDAEGAWHQVFYEDARSICAKQQLVSRMQLGGMGVFLADFISGHTNRTQMFWGALARAVGDRSVCNDSPSMMHPIMAIQAPFKSDDDVSLPPNIVPLPQHYEPGPSSGGSADLTLADSFTFTAAGKTSPTLEAALSRFGRLLGNSSRRDTVIKQVAEPDTHSLSSCGVSVSGTSMALNLDTDESYTLSISAQRVYPHDGSCSIRAKTVFGAMHGMESFVQLVSLVAQDRTVSACAITDEPRFKFRATMIDTSRHYYPLQTILDHLDAMSTVKMNVLHWHLVDIESFPYVSVAFPQLSAHGAYHPTEVYTPADIKRVVGHAQQLGIRVIPEIDTPGHVWAGFAAIPGLLTSCYSSGGGDLAIGTGPLDPTKEATFTFLQTLLAEIKSLFEDEMFMVGGDEVDFRCWQSNPEVVAFAAQKGWDNSSVGMKNLESYYAQRLLAILVAQNSSVMCWEQLFDNGVKLAEGTVVNVGTTLESPSWTWCTKPTGGSTAVQNNQTCSKVPTANSIQVRDDSWKIVMGLATAAGHPTVLSSPYYLNDVNRGSNFDEDWPFYYSVEPTDFEVPQDARKRQVTAAEKESLVAGVEACMWSEWVDSSNFAGRFWPRAAAVAERGWSSESTTGIDDFRRRIHRLTCEFKRRGLAAEPVVHGGQFFRENGTACQRNPRVLGPPAPGCLPRFSSCAGVCVLTL